MRRVEHSTDGGRTWHEVEVLPTSLVGSMALSREKPWHDGFGNWYRPVVA